MQMLAIVFRQSMETDILALLRACRVQTFSDIAEVLGEGETGLALHTFARPGVNSIVLAALPADDVARVVAALGKFRAAALARRRGGGVPLHAFVLPCEQVL